MINFDYGISLCSLNRDQYKNQTYLWRNDYEIWRWCRQNDLLLQENHNEWFDKIRKDPAIKMYGIMPYSTNTIVGVCGLTDIDRFNQRAEFSCYIAPEYQRRGYASAALKTLFRHGFDNQNLNLIWGETFGGNPALSLFKALGMTHDGTRPEFYYKEGNYIDAHLISLTREQYKKWSTTLWI